MCKTKVPSPVLGANKKLKMREKKKEGKKKTFQTASSQKKGNYFSSVHRNKYSFYTIMVHPQFQLLQIVTAFSQLHDYIQIIFETSVTQAGTKMEKSTSSKIEDKKKVWASNKNLSIISNIDAPSHYQFQFDRNCNFSSVSRRIPLQLQKCYFLL